ncbi:hypothetical protein PIB30_021252 [Stylosanthes scabra]|uniref:Uncharacterized protein n=1 Tax=Stylosanthes scabra TaxID=79078 RepID=A0ABU6W8X8_9FABA|nr:hypothetical protein [Stylosanthes scabra]
MDKLFEALAQERNEIREAQRKTEIQLDLWTKLATLVIERLTNSQPSNSGNLPSQPLLNPWDCIGIVFLYTNQEGREDALLNEEDVESLHECPEEVEEENGTQVAEDVDQKVEDNCKKPKGTEIVHSASSEVTPSKIPSELRFEWVNLLNLNFIGPQQYALLEKNDQLGALDGALDKKETESLELNASKFITCGELEFKSYSEHLHKLHNNRTKTILATLVTIANRPVVISVKSEIRRNCKIIARRYNTSLDLSRPVDWRRKAKNALETFYDTF